MAPQGPAALQVQKYKLKISQSNNRYEEGIWCAEYRDKNLPLR